MKGERCGKAGNEAARKPPESFQLHTPVCSVCGGCVSSSTHAVINFRLLMFGQYRLDPSLFPPIGSKIQEYLVECHPFDAHRIVLYGLHDSRSIGINPARYMPEHQNWERRIVQSGTEADYLWGNGELRVHADGAPRGDGDRAAFDGVAVSCCGACIE
jgi:hypothetical protein